jgi:hypothetical protein
MFPALTRSARRNAAAIAVLAAMSVLAQAAYLNGARGESFAATALDMARYFTILTNLLVVVAWGLAATLRGGVPAVWLAALTLSVVMAGAVYHVLLSDLIAFTGLGLWADHGLHTVVPLACLLWWMFQGPKRALVFADLPVFAAWPAVYMAYALWRGAKDGGYPYPFMDPTLISPAAVAANLAGLAVILLLGGVLMIAIGRYADR